MRIGARTIKTGIAITIAISICNYLAIGPVLLAALTTMLNIQPSISQSFKNAMDQIGISFLGIVVGLFLGFVFGSHAIIVGVASIIVIVLGQLFRFDDIVRIGVMTAIFIIDAPAADFFAHAVTRTQLIAVGLFVALAVNNFVVPPKYASNVLRRLGRFHEEVSLFFKEEISRFIHGTELSEDRTKQLEELMKEGVTLREPIQVLKKEMRDKALDWEKRMYGYEDLFQLNLHMLGKISLLQDISQKKFERRAEKGNQPYTNEFMEILTIIKEANNKISTNALNLGQAVLHDADLEAIVELVEMGSHLDGKIERWRERHEKDVYYANAFIELSIVVYHIRWVYNEQRRLHEKYFRQGKIGEEK